MRQNGQHSLEEMLITISIDGPQRRLLFLRQTANSCPLALEFVPRQL